MTLPKFWRDKGSWNDTVVTTAVILAMAGWAILGWRLDLLWLVGAAAILGPVTGVCLGVGAVALLCSYFARPDPSRVGEKQDDFTG